MKAPLMSKKIFHRAALFAVSLFCLVVQVLAQPPVHMFHRDGMPPGEVGQRKLLRGGPVPGYFQPVEVLAPEGTQISFAGSGKFLPGDADCAMAGLLIGQVYTLQLTSIPLNDGVELFPTIEVIDRLYPPIGLERKHPIEVEITQDEIDAALKGQLVTRIIYLEDPLTAFAMQGGPRDQRVQAVKSQDPLKVADRMGRPMAILRMGSRIPDIDQGTGRFIYGSPPIVKHYKRGQAPWDAKPEAPAGAGAAESARHSPALPSRGGRKSEIRQVAAQEPVQELGQDQDGGVIVPNLPPEPKNKIVQGVHGYTKPYDEPKRCSYSGAEFFPGVGPYLPTGVPDFSEPVGYACNVCGQPQGTPICDPPAPPAQWSPDGIARPWPRDEYLIDGGDQEFPARVNGKNEIMGVEPEDTIAAYEARCGKKCMTASNIVPIYSPRFAAVLKIENLVENQLNEALIRYDRGQPLNVARVKDEATSHLQNQQANKHKATKKLVAVRERSPGLQIENVDHLSKFVDSFRPYEDFRFIRSGKTEVTERLRLAERQQAALTWATPESVKVMIDNVEAISVGGWSGAQEFTAYDMEPGKCRLRLVKIASKASARPGEVVEFTLRFDNQGDGPLTNTVIVDNLTTRLEYIEGTAQSSVDAEFESFVNEAESTALKWTLTKPLPVGKGGIIRFHCRVR
jgi:uncharacterized repeat protein (TIGR01451 family)